MYSITMNSVDERERERILAAMTSWGCLIPSNKGSPPTAPLYPSTIPRICDNVQKIRLSFLVIVSFPGISIAKKLPLYQIVYLSQDVIRNVSRYKCLVKQNGIWPVRALHQASLVVVTLCVVTEEEWDMGEE